MTHVTWLYAIVPADRRPPPDVRGVAAEPLRTLSGPALAAVVGSVPRADFDERPLHAHLEDPVWLEHAVRAHHRVVEALAATGPALPLRFATLYHDDARAQALLRERHDELAEALRRIDGRTEWGVKAYLTDRPPAPEEETGPDDGDRPGTAYLLRRRARRQQREETLRQASDDAGSIHAQLAGLAVAAALHPPQSAETSGRAEPMVLNGSYLVDLVDGKRLADAVADIAEGHPRLRLELTGPWPPYSFADPGEV
ncbi:GvpL/GvpF family gas vesicle protein [Streptomyces sp. SP17BM10]|uniref:GvpL/GvpF family gas vesicle protein n=1 Tax=Streptomyces sp. SP17BM10 TaxID=3002530 RepID=UPI002E75FE75|nr:GvpL/GvpF family gas vesicle protein [Streptomyces sp. SP17BM10]MEE1787068.1 GvpL/GvpF family gas vesicle protein [Streptomyces sp. SP17BM10]